MCDFYLVRYCGPVVNPVAQHWWRVARCSARLASPQPSRHLAAAPSMQLVHAPHGGLFRHNENGGRHPTPA